LSFETCKFYYNLADAQLSKIENSTEVFNDTGANTTLTMDAIEKSMDKLPDVLVQSTNKVREMFETMAQKTGQSHESELQPVTAETTPPVETDNKEPNSDSKIVDNPTEASPEKVENKPESHENVGLSNEAQSMPKVLTKTNKDNPKIEDEEEEEIITTTKNPGKDEEEKHSEPDQEQDDDEQANDEFRFPWENLEVSLIIFNKTTDMHEDPEEFEQINWNLKADIMERQADLEIARESIDQAIKLYNELIGLCEKHN
jgi:hypothetical protein